MKYIFFDAKNFSRKEGAIKRRGKAGLHSADRQVFSELSEVVVGNVVKLLQPAQVVEPRHPLLPTISLQVTLIEAVVADPGKLRVCNPHAAALDGQQGWQLAVKDDPGLNIIVAEFWTVDDLSENFHPLTNEVDRNVGRKSEESDASQLLSVWIVSTSGSVGVTANGQSRRENGKDAGKAKEGGKG